MNFIIFSFISLGAAWLFSQTFKTLLNFCTTRRFKLKMLFSDGDFPSTHTTTAITGVIIACYELLPLVFDSTKPEDTKTLASTIVIAIVLWAMFIIRDALGIRLRVQELSHTVHRLLVASSDVEGAPISENLQVFWSSLAKGINLKVGHMPHEVIGGLILGIIFGFGSAFLRHGKLVLFIVDVVASVIYFIITFIVIGRNRKKVEEHKQKGE